MTVDREAILAAAKMFDYTLKSEGDDELVFTKDDHLDVIFTRCEDGNWMFKRQEGER